MAGLKRALREVMGVAKNDGPAEFNEFWCEGRGCPPGLARVKSGLWRLLKMQREPGSDGRRIVEGVPEDDGWEAWRWLHEHFEPSLAVRESQVLAELSLMTQRRAKNPAETKRLMLDLEDKIRKVIEVTGRIPDDARCKSIVLSFVDHRRRTGIAVSTAARTRPTTTSS